MKIISFNFRGLAGPLKRPALQRVVDLEHPDIMLLQETLGVGDVIKEKLENWFLGWNFVTLDVRGRSGGLVLEWNTRVVKALNNWGRDSVLGMTL